jgi:autoinducer 2-degrading protein
MPDSLVIVHVYVHVTAHGVEAFRAATVDNARHSVKEPGVARFDVVQSVEDPTRFVLIEVYRSPEAQAAHKETAHYQRWRDAVAELMAEPRTSARYVDVFPDAQGW